VASGRSEKAFPKIAVNAGFPRCRCTTFGIFLGHALSTGVSMEVVQDDRHSTLAITVTSTVTPAGAGHAARGGDAAIPRMAPLTARAAHDDGQGQGQGSSRPVVGCCRRPATRSR